MRERASLPLALLALGCVAPGPARAADASVPVCQVDSADPEAGPAWQRVERLLRRVQQRCAPGDVLWLFPFDRTGAATDPVTVAPLLCRFDAQILVHPEDNDGPRRLACLYAGGGRGQR